MGSSIYGRLFLKGAEIIKDINLLPLKYGNTELEDYVSIPSDEVNIKLKNDPDLTNRVFWGYREVLYNLHQVEEKVNVMEHEIKNLECKALAAKSPKVYEKIMDEVTEKSLRLQDFEEGTGLRKDLMELLYIKHIFQFEADINGCDEHNFILVIERYW